MVEKGGRGVCVESDYTVGEENCTDVASSGEGCKREGCSRCAGAGGSRYL